MRGECASRSPIRRKPSSGKCGVGGSPRSTSASGGAASSWRRSSIACWRDLQGETEYLAPSENASVSVISVSSSTISSAGFSSGDGRVVLIADALHESALQVRFGMALAQAGRRASETNPPALQHGDRGAQFFYVGEHVRGEKQRPAVGGQAP